MKTLKYLGGLVVVCMVFMGTVGARCPEMVKNCTLSDLQGKPAVLPCKKEKVLVVNVWATWCGACRLEIVQLTQLHQEFKNSNVDIVGITLDQAEPKTLVPLIKSFNIPYPVYLGKSDQVLASLSVFALPTTVIFDGNGNQYKKLIGYHDKEKIRSIVNEILQKNKLPDKS